MPNQSTLRERLLNAQEDKWKRHGKVFNDEDYYIFMQSEIDKARNEERERCAKIAKSYAAGLLSEDAISTSHSIASLIRQGSSKE